MKAARLGLVGYGAIGQAMVDWLAKHDRLACLSGILVRPERALPPGLPFCQSIDAFLASGPNVVVEAAGHEALRDYGPAILRRGVDLVISSVGALADNATQAAIRSASVNGGTAVLPSGAIAGLDGLAAARIAGLDRVVCTSAKPPAAWRGTKAEEMLDLDALSAEAVFFTGSAREAATAFPKNANVSAAIALAGIGLDATEVRLIASPTLSAPLGIIEANGNFGWFEFKIHAAAFPQNPKTSMLTAFSLLQCALSRGGIPLA